MCGISGFVDFNKNSSESILIKMTDTLIHRGPDGSGAELIENDFAQIGFGHRRLSIIDLTETGKQPMRFGHLTITFNGEIYNFNEIKKELSSLGHSFTGNSDTEVILHAFAEWEEKCVQKFIGMFAFVLYNDRDKTITCFRDRAGIKPFYYYFKNGLFLFSSELKSFHFHPGFQKEINLDAVGAFMQYGNVPSQYCIFKNCNKLKPGHFLKFSLAGKQIKEHRYWNVFDYYNLPKTDVSYNEAKEQTEKLLKSAFEYRMVSDVPVGIFLSGGYDSSCVTSILQKDRSEKLKTFTISIPELGFDEAPDARKIANVLGTDHHEMECTQKEALELIDDIPYYYDEPFADSSAIPTTLVCKMAGKAVTVVLSADGGDELFAGYYRYDYMMNVGRKIQKTPSFVRSAVSGIMDMIPPEKIPYLKKTWNFENRYNKLNFLLKNPEDSNFVQSMLKIFPDSNLQNLFLKDVSILETAHKGQKINKASYSSLAYQMAVDYETYLVDDILQKVDRATMTASIEGREPFLDHRLIEWVAQLPDSFKYRNGIKKFMLKDIVHQYLPKELMDKPKRGFGVPIHKWLSGDLKSYVDEYLSEETIVKQDIFSWNYIKKLKTDFYRGKHENDYELWYLLMFQMWFKRWM